MACNAAHRCSTNAEMCEIDAPLPTADVPDGCFGHNTPNALLTVCPPALPATARILMSDINTDDDCDFVAQGQYCVIMGTNLSVVGTIKATGTPPLVLLGTMAVTIPAGSELDLIGEHDKAVPGVAAASCLGGSPGIPDLESAGGGGGGSFTTQGGDGGNYPSFGGQPGDSHVANTIAGGCRGFAGGDGDSAQGGVGGGGGGALYVIGGDAVSINGSINTSGEGGLKGDLTETPGNGGGGGGGGGAGGFIALDAPQIVLGGTSVMLANGGGGGGGGASGVDGKDGKTPDAAIASQATMPALGGAGGGGTDGGMGAALGQAAHAGLGSAMAGGGGGGGGIGAIYLFSATVVRMAGAQVSPMPM
jgi:hypothetical protein